MADRPEAMVAESRVSAVVVRWARRILHNSRGCAPHCTTIARRLRDQYGGVILGFDASTLQGHILGTGHDFLVIDGFVYDPWMGWLLEEAGASVTKLNTPTARDNYGHPADWEPVE